MVKVNYGVKYFLIKTKLNLTSSFGPVRFFHLVVYPILISKICNRIFYLWSNRSNKS